MRIYIKLAMRNLMRKKLRYLLLFLTFILSSLTLMTSLFFKDAAIMSREDKLRTETLNSQILIRSANMEAPYFDKTETMDKLVGVSGIAYAVPRMSIGANFDSKDGELVTLIGTDYSLQSKIFSFDIIEGSNFEPFEDKVIIGEGFAKANGLVLNDTISFYYDNRVEDFKIAGIAKDEGIFTYNGMIVAPFKEVQQLYRQGNKASTIGITLEKLDEIAIVKDSLKRALGRSFIVEERYDLEFYKTFVGTIEMAVNIFACFAIFITLFLTYSTFKTIIFERINEIGTLRSIGTTKKEIFISIYTENFLLVLVSSIAGILVSIPFIKHLLRMFIQKEIIMELDVIKISYIFVGMLVVGLLSIITSMLKVMNIPVVDIIKGNIKKELKASKHLRSILGIALMGASIYALYFYEKSESGLIYLLTGLTAFVLAFILLIELLHRLLNATLFRLFSFIGPEVRLVLKEFRRDFAKSTQSIVLVTIVIAIAYLSFVSSYLVGEAVNKVYGDIDIYLKGINSEEAIDGRLSSISGVDSIVSQLRTNRKINNIDVEISGIEPDKYSEVSFEVFKSSSKEEALSKLKEGRSVIVTTTFLKNSKKKVGDYIAIRTGEEYVDYKIVDVCSSFENMGKVLFISKDNFIKDIIHNNHILYLVKTKEGYDPEQVLASIEDELRDDEYESIITLKQMFRENQKENDKLFLLINALFFISAFVSIICLNNNLIINILTRARVYAIERTIGMSKAQLRKVITFEGMMLCIEGGILGLILGCFMNIYLVRILSFYIGDLAITINYMIIAVLIGVSVLIGLISGIYPYNKMCKMNIVQAIKGFE